MDEGRKDTRKLLGAIAFGVALFVGLWHLDVVLAFLGSVFGVVRFFIIGLCIAFILCTPVRLIETRLLSWKGKRPAKAWYVKLRRPLSIALTILLLLAVVNLVVFMVIPEFGRTFTLIGNEFPAFMANVNLWLDDLSARYGDIVQNIRLDTVDWDATVQSALDLLKNGAGNLLTGTFTAASSFVGSIVSFVMGFILAIYVLYSKEKLASQCKRLLYAYLPCKRVDRLLEIGTMANRTFSSFITGQFFEALILGALCFVGMLICGFPFAPMVSVLVCVTAFIPIFGAFIAAAVGAFLILVHKGWLLALWFIVFFIVLQQIEGNLIYPHVMGKSVMLPGIWVLTAVTIGGNVWGILGMLVSVPLASVLYTLLRQAVNRRNAARGIVMKQRQ